MVSIVAMMLKSDQALFKNLIDFIAMIERRLWFKNTKIYRQICVKLAWNHLSKRVEAFRYDVLAWSVLNR